MAEKFLLMGVGVWPDGMSDEQKDKAVQDFIAAIEGAVQPFQDQGIHFDSLRLRIEQAEAFPL